MNAARRCAAKVGFPPFGRPGIVCPRNGRRTTTTDGRIRCADGLNLSEIPGSIVQVKYLFDFFRARLCATLSIGGRRKGLHSRDGDASCPSNTPRRLSRPGRWFVTRSSANTTAFSGAFRNLRSKLDLSILRRYSAF